MKRLILALFIIVSISSFTQTNKSLQKKIDSLEARVVALEKIMSPAAPTTQIKANENVKPPYKVRDNWRMLHIGMSTYNIKDIFGEPQKIFRYGGAVTWSYPSGSISFYDDRVDGWTEPNYFPD